MRSSVLASFWSLRPDVEDEPLYIASKVTCILHRPLHYDEKVVFTAAVDKIGVRSVGFIVAADAAGQRAAEVEIIWQARAREDRTPVPLPEITRDWPLSLRELVSCRQQRIAGHPARPTKAATKALITSPGDDAE